MTDALTLPPLLQKLLEVSKTPIVEMKLSESESPSALTDSKIGGIGYLPEGEAYPYKEDGTPLDMLIQLNFAQLAAKVDLSVLPHALPNSGLLQVYIDPTCDLYGCDFDDYTQHEGYQVRFWQDLTVPANQNSIDTAQQKLKHLTEDDDVDLLSPLDTIEEIAIDFVLNTQSANPNCIEFEKFIATLDPNLEDQSLFAYLESLDLDNADDIYDTYANLADNTKGHYILGYPDFTQADPREYDDDLKQYILLFQIDSDHELDILWGDCGIANFFITPEALANKDFSQLLYNWDCG